MFREQQAIRIPRSEVEIREKLSTLKQEFQKEEILFPIDDVQKIIDNNLLPISGIILALEHAIGEEIEFFYEKSHENHKTMLERILSGYGVVHDMLQNTTNKRDPLVRPLFGMIRGFEWAAGLRDNLVTKSQRQ